MMQIDGTEYDINPAELRLLIERGNPTAIYAQTLLRYADDDSRADGTTTGVTAAAD